MYMFCLFQECTHTSSCKHLWITIVEAWELDMDPSIVFIIGGELLDDSIKPVIDSGVVGPLLGPSLQQLLELGEIPTKTHVVTLCGLIEVEPGISC